MSKIKPGDLVVLAIPWMIESTYTGIVISALNFPINDHHDLSVATQSELIVCDVLWTNIQYSFMKRYYASQLQLLDENKEEIIRRRWCHVNASQIW